MEFILQLLTSDEGRFAFTFGFIFLSSLLIALGYVFGELSALRNDIKSLDYDNVVAENIQLRSAIELKKDDI